MSRLSWYLIRRRPQSRNLTAYVPDRNGTRAFAANRREEFFEIAAPKPGKVCAYLSTDASGAPVGLSPEFAARVAQTPDMEESSLAAADPALEFPALRAANASWSKHPLLQGVDSLGFDFGTGVRGTRRRKRQGDD